MLFHTQTDKPGLAIAKIVEFCVFHKILVTIFGSIELLIFVLHTRN